jgi:hypothetical protein
MCLRRGERRAGPTALRAVAVLSVLLLAARTGSAQPVLSVSGTCPGEVTLSVSGAPPSTEVGVIAAANTNGFTKGGALCNGTRFEIGEPFVLPPTWIVVDAAGAGSGHATLPANRCWVEALALAGCGTSVAVEVPPPAPGPNPDPPCFDESSRFVNCANGTVTDTVTGLVWLFDADCFGNVDYASANAAASSLSEGQCGLTDGSRPGDWRLATLSEWAAMVRPECTGSPRIVGNGPAGGCFSSAPWAMGVQSWYYWSSTTITVSTSSAWVAAMTIGQTAPGFKVPAGLGGVVWPVRGGQ